MPVTLFDFKENLLRHFQSYETKKNLKPFLLMFISRFAIYFVLHFFCAYCLQKVKNTGHQNTFYHNLCQKLKTTILSEILKILQRTRKHYFI